MGPPIMFRGEAVTVEDVSCFEDRSVGIGWHVESFVLRRLSGEDLPDHVYEALTDDELEAVNDAVWRAQVEWEGLEQERYMQAHGRWSGLRRAWDWLAWRWHLVVNRTAGGVQLRLGRVRVTLWSSYRCARRLGWERYAPGSYGGHVALRPRSHSMLNWMFSLEVRRGR